MTNLEITADDEQINTVPAFDSTSLLDRGIDGVEGAMALQQNVRMSEQSPGLVFGKYSRSPRWQF